jgi:cytoskeletal protein CcmA (bactofilin family)
MRRVWPLAFLLALLALGLPAASSAAEATGDAEDAVVVISGDVTVPRGKTVDAIVVADGDVRLAGHADGDVVLFAGDATISGRIDGDLVTFGGRARLLPRAYVAGDVRYGDDPPVIAKGATVRGDVDKEAWNDSLEFLPFVGAFVLWLGVTISAAILGVLLLLLAPRAADAVCARSRGRIGPVIGIGIAVAICLPLAAVIAAVTLVGIPLALGILLALLPLGAVAYVASAWVLGRRLVGRPRGRILSFLAGLAILRLLALIPFLGFLVGLAAVVFGLGLIAVVIWAAREPAAVPARSPGS